MPVMLVRGGRVAPLKEASGQRTRTGGGHVSKPQSSRPPAASFLPQVLRPCGGRVGSHGFRGAGVTLLATKKGNKSSGMFRGEFSSCGCALRAGSADGVAGNDACGGPSPPVWLN